MAFLGFPGNPGIKEEPRLLKIILVRSSNSRLFCPRKSPENMDHFLLAFLGFPGNRGIKEEQGSARNPSQMPPESVKYFVLASLRASSPIWASELSLARTHDEGPFLCPLGLRRSLARSRVTRFTRPNRRAGYLLAFQETPGSRKSQGVPEIILVKSSGGFFALKENPGKRGKFCHGFPGFSRNSWKTRRAPTLLAFPGFLLAFPHLQKSLENQTFYPRIPGSFLRGPGAYSRKQQYYTLYKK